MFTYYLGVVGFFEFNWCCRLRKNFSVGVREVFIICLYVVEHTK